MAFAMHSSSLKIGHNLDVAVAAAKTDLKAGTSVAVLGTTYAVPDLIAKLESYQSAYAGVRDTRSALHELIVQRDQLEPEVVAFLGSLKAAVVNLFGTDSPELEKFGFKPKKKRAPLTSEQAFARAAKAKATRVKRGTLGRKQKAALKFTGTPIVTVSLPSEPPSPASSAAASGAPTVGVAVPVSGVASPGSAASAAR